MLRSRPHRVTRRAELVLGALFADRITRTVSQRYAVVLALGSEKITGCHAESVRKKIGNSHNNHNRRRQLRSCSARDDLVCPGDWRASSLTQLETRSETAPRFCPSLSLNGFLFPAETVRERTFMMVR